MNMRRDKLKISKKQLRRIIKEEFDNMLSEPTPEDVVPVEDAWAGGEDLVMPIDHSEAGGSEPVTSFPETLDIVDSITERVMRRLRGNR